MRSTPECKTRAIESWTHYHMHCLQMFCAKMSNKNKSCLFLIQSDHVNNNNEKGSRYCVFKIWYKGKMRAIIFESQLKALKKIQFSVSDTIQILFILWWGPVDYLQFSESHCFPTWSIQWSPSFLYIKRQRFGISPGSYLHSTIAYFSGPSKPGKGNL